MFFLHFHAGGDSFTIGSRDNQVASEDKETILSAVKSVTDWINSNGQSTTREELEDKLSGEQFQKPPMLNGAHSR